MIIVFIFIFIFQPRSEEEKECGTERDRFCCSNPPNCTALSRRTAETRKAINSGALLSLAVQLGSQRGFKRGPSRRRFSPRAWFPSRSARKEVQCWLQNGMEWNGMEDAALFCSVVRMDAVLCDWQLILWRWSFVFAFACSMSIDRSLRCSCLSAAVHRPCGSKPSKLLHWWLLCGEWAWLIRAYGRTPELSVSSFPRNR